MLTIWKRLPNRFTQNVRIVKRVIISSCKPVANVKKETTAELIISYCSNFPDRVALIDDERNIKYKFSDVKNSIHAIASGLTKNGVGRGTVAGIIASNSPEYLFLIYALSSIGCTVTVCNQNYTKSELKIQLKDSNPSILFASEDCLGKVSETASQLSNVKDIYILGHRVQGYKSVEDLMIDSGNMSPIGQLELDLDEDLAILPYSSGTSGLPKGVMLTHTNFVSFNKQLQMSHESKENDSYILMLPMYHVYGLICIPNFLFGLGLPAVVQPRFDSVKMLKAIEKYKIAVLHLVPPLVLFLLNHPMVKQYDLSSVRKVVCGAASLDQQLENRIIEKFIVNQPEFYTNQGYGLTETCGVSHITPNGNDNKKKSGSIGQLISGVECKIVSTETRQELPADEIGEILLRGPNIMKGYYRNTLETSNSFENGWFKTGDTGYYDSDHYFYISGRIKELIKVKGQQVAPAELEAILLMFPGITDCAVVGIPDERFGEVPKAFVVTDREITTSEIHSFIESHLSTFKHLKGGIKFVKEIPKSPSGKILRRLLK